MKIILETTRINVPSDFGLLEDTYYLCDGISFFLIFRYFIEYIRSIQQSSVIE